jgi:hypothetical protein
MTGRTAALAAALMLAAAAPAPAQELKPGANRVTFASEGETLVGDLYLPASYRAGDRLPAVVVTGPWLTVKEQTAGAYARELAERGLATLAFDFRYWGESGGEPRQWEDPDSKIRDIRSAVAFLRTVPAVSGGRIGALGVCFSAGYVAAAAAEDPHIRSVATVAAWLHDSTTLDATFGADEIRRRWAVGRAARERWRASRAVDYVPAHSTTDRTAAMYQVDFYADASRGAIPQWTNRMAVMSWPGWLGLDGPAIGARVAKPLMVVHSDGSALPQNARRFFQSATGPKELVWLEGNHTDFYDRPAYVRPAATALARHFTRTLGAAPASADAP